MHTLYDRDYNINTLWKLSCWKLSYPDKDSPRSWRSSRSKRCKFFFVNSISENYFDQQAPHCHKRWKLSKLNFSKKLPADEVGHEASANLDINAAKGSSVKIFPTMCWILSLCSAIKGCISETFSLDEHFQVQRLLIKYSKYSNDANELFEEVGNLVKRNCRRSRIPKPVWHLERSWKTTSQQNILGQNKDISRTTVVGSDRLSQNIWHKNFSMIKRTPGIQLGAVFEP